MAEPIEMPFGLWTRMGPRKHLLHGGAHWLQLVNTIEPAAMRPLCQITLTPYYTFDNLLFTSIRITGSIEKKNKF